MHALTEQVEIQNYLYYEILSKQLNIPNRLWMIVVDKCFISTKNIDKEKIGFLSCVFQKWTLDFGTIQTNSNHRELRSSFSMLMKNIKSKFYPLKFNPYFSLSLNIISIEFHGTLNIFNSNNGILPTIGLKLMLEHWWKRRGERERKLICAFVT